MYDRIGNKIGETLIDLEDIPKVKSIGWHLTPSKRNTRYCISNKGVLLHRLLMDDPEGMVIDHINHNEPDNRNCNLERKSVVKGKSVDLGGRPNIKNE